MKAIEKAREYERDMMTYKRLKEKKEGAELTPQEKGIYDTLRLKIKWCGLASCCGILNRYGLPDGDECRKIFPDLDTEDKLDEMLLTYDDAIKEKWKAVGGRIGMDKVMKIYEKIIRR